jgi:hypothetical protein
MVAAYIFNLINLVCGLLTIPLTLRYLDQSEFILWSIFIIWGGLTLQFENALQVVSVRSLARALSSKRLISESFLSIKGAYKLLSIVTITIITSLGAIYLNWLDYSTLNINWLHEWFIFMAAYAINYWFGPNSVYTLAIAKTTQFYYVLSLTRIVYFSLSLLLLIFDFGVSAISISFFISVIINCLLIYIVIRKNKPKEISNGLGKLNREISGIGNETLKYLIFSIAAYLLYKGSVLYAAYMYGKEEVSEYALSIQALSMITIIATSCIQIWLPGLVNTIIKKDINQIVIELLRTILVVNLVFFLGAFILLTVIPEALGLIKSNVLLPARWKLAVISIAFFLEINILILINVLVTMQNYCFVKIYTTSTVFSLALGLILAINGVDLMISLVAIPSVIQSTITYPLILKKLSLSLHKTRAVLIHEMVEVVLKWYGNRL